MRGWRRRQRRWTITLAGVGTAIAAAGLSLVLVLVLPPGGGQLRPAGSKAVALIRVPVPVWPVRAAAPAHLHAAVQLMSPFTGEPVKALGRVVVVKIDNIV